MKTGPVTLRMTANSGPAVQSLLGLFEVLRSSRRAMDTFADRFPEVLDTEVGDRIADLSSDALNLFLAEPIRRATNGALEFLIGPSDRYLELVSAIAGYGDYTVNFDSHGWPSLQRA